MLCVCAARVNRTPLFPPSCQAALQLALCEATPSMTAPQLEQVWVWGVDEAWAWAWT